MANDGPLLVVLPPVATDQGSPIAQGLMEDVCGVLTRFSALRVVSWMSGAAVAYLSDRELGDRLGATHALRGRVEMCGNGLRVTASLAECEAGTQLWSEPLELSNDDPLEIRDELAGRIRDLQDELSRAEDHHDLGRAERAREELAAWWTPCPAHWI